MGKSETRYGDVRAAFTEIAPDFENSFENPTTAGFREEVYRVVTALIRPGDSVLDINCGTGIDANALAHRGFKVTGVDISPGMLREAAKKAARRPNLSLEFLESSFDDLSAVSGRTFDLVLSNFGGVNCTDVPGRVFEQVAGVTKPGGYFLAVIMPRVSLWEIIAGLTRFDLRSAFRRMRKSAPSTGFGGHTFQVHYFSLRALLREASQWFTTRWIRGVWILSPPPHAESFRRRLPGLSSFLARIERRIAKLPIFRALGDHVMILFQRAPKDGSKEPPIPFSQKTAPWTEMVSAECRRLAAGMTVWNGDPEFSRMLEGKRVVIAGPARTLAGKGLGGLIDSFDLVVRLNESVEWIIGNPAARQDYGSRTDILYCNQSILRRSFLENTQHGDLWSLCRSGTLRYIVCTNNSLDFDGQGAPSKTCVRADNDIIHTVQAALRSAGVSTRLRVVRSASEWSMRMLRGHWGRTGFIAIADLLGFPIAHLMVTGMTFYHGGGHILAEGHGLHPLGNRNGTIAGGPGGSGHNSFLEAEVFRELQATFSGRISVDEALSGIMAMVSTGSR
ncbi:MAG: hypothetical protein HBSIN02_13010 [Bacteroidia bacterium]|nr:MAG: hypothetical protein HBSIN02_13010 [Bacteroidia bacterium]